MKEYKIDIGNSNEGQIGACIYIKARSKRDAINKAEELFCDSFEDRHSGLNVYFNWTAVTTKNVERVE